MIDVVLIEPETSGNIGAIARVMKNFGFLNLVIVSPKCEVNEGDAIRFSKHAKDVLQNAKIAGHDILDSYDYRVATTAKLGSDYNLYRTPIDADQFAKRYSELDNNTKVALIIGREGVGLLNEEIAKCDFIVTIPANSEYSTLNISHAVSILLYEIFKQSSGVRLADKFKPISGTEKDVLLGKVNEILNSLSFSTDKKKETQVKVWKRIVAKSFLTNREAYALFGFLTKIIEKITNKNDKK